MNLLDGRNRRLTLNAVARADLVFPLRRHDLGVDTGDLDTGVHASAVVSLDNITAVDLAGSDTAVVGALGTGETALGPSVGPAVVTEEGVFLFQTEPELLLGIGLHQAVGVVTVVELVGGSIGVPGFAEDEDVVTETEGVGEDGNGAQVDIGVIAGGLARRGTVEVPFGELIDRLDGLGEGLSRSKQKRLAAEQRGAWDASREERVDAGTEQPRAPCASAYLAGSSSRDKTIFDLHQQKREGKKKKKLECAYLGLAAAATDGVNPDVFGLDGTSLIEGHVLHELLPAHITLV